MNKKTPKPAAKRGRPSGYSKEVADAICERLSNGESLLQICRDDAMPSDATVRKWAMEDTGGFFSAYTRARDLGYERMAEEIVELSDTVRPGVKTRTLANGSVETLDADAIERTRLQVETRRWLLERCLPKRYGTKTQTELTGADGGPIRLESMTDEQLLAIVAGKP